METRFYTSPDNVRIAYNIWCPENEIKALIHINHGMAEHSNRYDRFAKELNKEGFLVFAQDHRGHGKTISEEHVRGHLADEDGWKKLCQDAHEISLVVSEMYPDYPILLLGHSMGSFIARKLIIDYPNFYKASIIMGTGYKANKLLSSLGKSLSKKGVKKLGNKPNSKLDKLVFGNFAKKIENARTPFDWLSRDEIEVKKYIEDDNCGYPCSSKFYGDLIELNSFVNNAINLDIENKEQPILFISGDCDPVGNNAKGVKKVYELYKKVGYKNIHLKLIEGARHELLNEINRDEITEFIINWYKSKLSY